MSKALKTAHIEWLLKQHDLVLAEYGEASIFSRLAKDFKDKFNVNLNRIEVRNILRSKRGTGAASKYYEEVVKPRKETSSEPRRSPLLRGAAFYDKYGALGSPKSSKKKQTSKESPEETRLISHRAEPKDNSPLLSEEDEPRLHRSSSDEEQTQDTAAARPTDLDDIDDAEDPSTASEPIASSGLNNDSNDGVVTVSDSDDELPKSDPEYDEEERQQSSRIARQLKLPAKAVPPPINKAVITRSMTPQQVLDTLNTVDLLQGQTGWVLRENVSGELFQQLTHEVLTGFGVPSWGARTTILNLQLKNVSVGSFSQKDMQRYTKDRWGISRPPVVKAAWSLENDDNFVEEVAERVAEREKEDQQRLEKQAEKIKAKDAKVQNLQIYEVKKKGNGMSVHLSSAGISRGWYPLSGLPKEVKRKVQDWNTDHEKQKQKEQQEHARRRLSVNALCE